MQTSISVEKISKKFTIGKSEKAYKTIREDLTDFLQAPFKKRRRKDHEEDSSQDRSFWALQEVSFTINQGEAVGIIGNNGAGKSTLLKILSRIIEPTQGKSSIYGRVGSLLEVGTGFHPELSGRENIFLNGAILGMKRKEILQNFDAIVAFAEIEQFLDTPVKFYSSGMYIRLAFGVAAHLNPEILIVDEVLAVGDVNFQKKCLAKLENVTQSGRTVLFVSHNLAAVRSLCQRAILMEKGKITEDGPVKEVVKKYLEKDQTSSNSRLWPLDQAPGNSYFKLRSVCCKDERGTCLSFLNISEPAVIEIIFEVVTPGFQASFSLHVYDSEGVCVFCSLNNHEANYYGKPLACGLYKSECHLYPNLFNEGTYYFSIIGFSNHRSDCFVADRVLHLQTVDDGVLKGDFHGGYSGCIRPKLHWMTEPSS